MNLGLCRRCSEGLPILAIRLARKQLAATITPGPVPAVVSSRCRLSRTFRLAYETGSVPVVQAYAPVNTGSYLLSPCSQLEVRAAALMAKLVDAPLHFESRIRGPPVERALNWEARDCISHPQWERSATHTQKSLQNRTIGSHRRLSLFSAKARVGLLSVASTCV